MAAALGIPRRRLRTWLKAGLVPPRTADVQLDLKTATLLRQLNDLHAAGLHAAQVRTTLERFKRWLPRSAEPLAQIAVVDRRTPLIRLREGLLIDADGQLRLDFEAAEGSAPAGRIEPQAPISAADWHEQGVQQELAGHLADAISSYTHALRLSPQDLQLMFDLAYAYALQGNMQEAIELYQQVVNLDPLQADAWVNLADALLAAGKPTASMEALERALHLSPDDPAVHYNLADALTALGRAHRARFHFAAFVRLTPGPSAHKDYALGQLV